MKLVFGCLAVVCFSTGVVVGENLSDANLPVMSDMAPMTTSASAPAASIPLTADAKAVLDMLHDRKATLKDFTSDIDYAVENKAGDLDGKRGKANYVDNGTVTKFSFDFTKDTFEGKVTHLHHTQLTSDGTDISAIDYEAKQFNRFPAPTNSLKSPIPIPLGIKVEDVTANFNVTVLPAKDPSLVALRFTPLMKGRFDYDQLDLTVDMKLQIPVKVVVHAPDNGQITTVKFLAPEINSGKAVIPAVAVPSTADGWTVKITGAATEPGK